MKTMEDNKEEEVKPITGKINVYGTVTGKLIFAVRDVIIPKSTFVLEKINEEPKPVLCFVEFPWAYFTTQNLELQNGEDWNKRQRSHNAMSPYVWREDDGPKYEISKIAFQCNTYELIDDEFTVDYINSGNAPWMIKDVYGHIDVAPIFAGITMDEFMKLIFKAGGRVYTEVVEATHDIMKG
jgi:hypothetical protein